MIEIKLEKNFSYAFNGEEKFAGSIILQEPRAVWAKHFATIKKEINKAISVQQEKDKNKKVNQVDDKEEMPADEVGKVMMMLVSLHADPVIIYNTFEELIKAGLVKIADTNILMTSAMFEKLSLDDFNRIIESYIGNFMKS